MAYTNMIAGNPLYTIGNLTLTTSGSSSPFYTTSATSTSATTANWNGTNWNQQPVTIGQSGTIDLKGEDADIRINGMSLSKSLKAIESRLAILTPAVEVEAEWAELKRLGDEYRALEKEIRVKMKTWDSLKKDY